MNSHPEICALEELANEAAMKFVMADKADNASITEIMNTIKKLLNDVSPRKANGLKSVFTASAAIEKFCRETIGSEGKHRETSFYVLGESIASLQSMITSIRNSKSLSCDEEGAGETLNAVYERLTADFKSLSSAAKSNSMPQLAAAAGLIGEIIYNHSNGRAPIQSELDKAASSLRVLFAGGINENFPAPQAGNKGPEITSGKAESAPQNSCVDASLIQDFIHEAGEHLDAVDTKLLMLETDSKNSEAINSVFRAFHTLKSLSGFLEISQMHVLVKEVENLLGQARNGSLKLEGEAIETVFRATDISRLMVDGLKVNPLERELVNEEKIYEIIDDIKMVLSGGVLIKKIHGTETAAGGDKSGGTLQNSGAAGSMIKIDSSKLHLLLDIIGETVIAESMVANDNSVTGGASIGLINSVNQLTKTTKMLHELGLSLRLVPVNSTFQKMARIARDLSKKHNKQINFTLAGEETEIDRSVVELINDPLVHMIRNAVDHGIENSPSERRKLGKNETGTVALKAYHRGGNICIEISDDGRGLDPAKIRSKAVELGFIQPDSSLSDAELFRLIFMPGFSTAGTVTDTSGRGVGMDVVKRNIEALHGRVDIESEKDRHTKFIITMPLTTAIIEAIVVRSGEEKFMIPALSIVESIRPSYGNITPVAGRGMMIALRGEFVPVVSLRNLFYDANESREDVVGQIVVVVEDNNKRLGIAVDELLDRQQIVVKSMGKAIGKTEGIAGCTIMSDGRVGLIFDIPRMIKMATGRGGDSNDSNGQ